MFELAVREGWALRNPVKEVERPRSADADPDIRFLQVEELEALLRAVPEDDLGQVERVMYLTAAMTGMRQDELLALRWMDVDWLASRLRVRRNRGLVSAALREVFNAHDATDARQRAGHVLERLAPVAPKVCGLLEDAEEDLTAFYLLPREHWTKLPSTNRWNASTKRSADAAMSSGSSPTTKRRSA